MTTRVIWAIAACLALGGCTEAIQMRNPSTGQVATCGNHPLAFPIYATIAATHDHECVQDYKDLGYVRAATN
jgi:hypothetical protein